MPRQGGNWRSSRGDLVLGRPGSARRCQRSGSRSRSADPEGGFSPYFTDGAAWELVADKLDAGHDVEVVELRKPRGAKGYVMHIRLGPDEPLLYVKLQLGRGKVIGRSFHYSDRS